MIFNEGVLIKITQQKSFPRHSSFVFSSQWPQKGNQQLPLQWLRQKQKKPDTYVPELTAASEAAKLLRETVAL